MGQLGVVVLALCVLALAVAGGMYWSRLRTLTGRVGSFRCALRPEHGHGEPLAGVAQYCVGRLEWWRINSLAPRPARSWQRSRIEVVSRGPDPVRPYRVLLRCRHEGEDFDLSLTPEASAGLVSWLEAAPADVNRVV